MKDCIRTVVRLPRNSWKCYKPNSRNLINLKLGISWILLWISKVFILRTYIKILDSKNSILLPLKKCKDYKIYSLYLPLKSVAVGRYPSTDGTEENSLLVETPLPQIFTEWRYDLCQRPKSLIKIRRCSCHKNKGHLLFLTISLLSIGIDLSQLRSLRVKPLLMISFTLQWRPNTFIGYCVFSNNIML